MTKLKILTILQIIVAAVVLFFFVVYCRSLLVDVSEREKSIAGLAVNCIILGFFITVALYYYSKKLKQKAIEEKSES